MICYLILHYIAKEETIKCINSLKEKDSNNIKIIVVDNASPNNSGEELLSLYKNDSMVEVLLNSENSGFASGNNFGYKYIKDNYKPDFIVIMNNDVEISTENFSSKLNKVYDEEKFHILGPDVFSTTYNLHQSPKRLKNYSYEEIKALNNHFYRQSNDLLKIKIKSIIKSFSPLRNFIYRYRNNKLNIDFSKKYYNVPLHGAFVVFSKDYFEKEEFAFQPGTFFYYEMEILDYICTQKEYKTIYCPELKVLHHQNISTNIVYNSMLKKTIFANRCNYDSTKVFLEVMESYMNKGVK
ncbi:glycosyltransferase [Streptococcus pacificus]|uniref:Glycosyltransferase family 2 protein n=1 Tax=Streptococcus pacificus TaxID=2740577 RepID=A0ABS0ZHD5_9STRE|nr:glycosyltransferase [Streptococcus pacificus]MBJ8325402.1 glycosyltransferase family 2 protein [Streptococcus pacificus]